MRVFLSIAFVLSVIGGAFFLLGLYATEHFMGSLKDEQRFEVLSGENAYALAVRLEQQGIVFSRFTFFWHLVYEEKNHKIIAGQYMLSGSLTVPEIALIITTGKTLSRDVKITFPEGWTFSKMADRLTANALPGKEFLSLAQKPLSEWKTRFDFLAGLPASASLEGYLFPDTYLFAPEATAEEIVVSMLQNFGKKWKSIDGATKNGTSDQKRIHEVITLASIIEEEGKTKEERDMISDIFWKRLAIGQPLQSDATVNYIHGTTRLQPTFKDIEIDSPYNTYKNKGLPPGPISNPSLDSLHAALFPKSNPYYYFLVDMNTGETFYGITFEDHIRNRNLHGL